MKTLLVFVMIQLLFIPIGSCITENFHGFPKKISIPAQGGEFTFNSDGYLLALTLTATPLNGIKKREAYLKCSFGNGDEYADIKVIQKK